MKSLHILLLSILPALLSCATVPPRMRVHRVEVSDNRLFLPVTVNGIPTMGLLGSPTEETILDDDFARRLGIKSRLPRTETGPPDIATIEADLQAAIENFVGIELDFGGFGSSGMPVVDLAELSQRSGRTVDLRLGRETHYFPLRIDIEKGTVQRLEFNSARRGTRLPLGDWQGAPTFAVVVEGRQPVAAVFDLGNGGAVRVSRAYAAQIGLTQPHRNAARSVGGDAREPERVILRSLEIGGHSFSDVPAELDPSDGAAALNVGVSVLRHFIITTDLLQRTLWLEPRK